MHDQRNADQFRTAMTERRRHRRGNASVTVKKYGLISVFFNVFTAFTRSVPSKDRRLHQSVGSRLFSNILGILTVIL